MAAAMPGGVLLSMAKNGMTEQVMQLLVAQRPRTLNDLDEEGRYAKCVVVFHSRKL